MIIKDHDMKQYVYYYYYYYMLNGKDTMMVIGDLMIKIIHIGFDELLLHKLFFVDYLLHQNE